MGFSFTYTCMAECSTTLNSGLVFATAREAEAAGCACMDADDTEGWAVVNVMAVPTDRTVNCVFTDERYLAEVDRAILADTGA